MASVQSSSPPTHEHEQQLHQLQQHIATLTNQCAQLDEANRAWQQYQQTQLNNFTNIIHNYLPIDDNASLEHIAQQIVDQITTERQHLTEQCQTLEQINNDLQSGNQHLTHSSLSLYLSISISIFHFP